MLSLPELGQLFESYRRAHAFKGTVAELYAPAQYLMDLGGKRIRPLSTLVAHQLYHDEVDLALPAALAMEVFHNFSLMHDDIMDESPCAAIILPSICSMILMLRSSPVIGC